MGTAVKSRRRVAPVGRPPQADQREVREAILKAALELFGDKGFDACSLHEIAARAGVTKPMIHYYFDSKAGLLRAVVEGVLTGIFERLRALATDGTRSVRERVEILARDHRDSCEKQPQEARLMRRVVFTDPPRGLPPFDRKQMTRMLSGFYQSFLMMAEQGVRSGELRGDARIIASLLHAVFAYTPMVELLFSEEPRGRCGRWTEEMFASLWAGLLPAREQGV